MRKLVKLLALALAVSALLFGGLVAFLGSTTPKPRTSTAWERLPDLPRPRGEVGAAVGARVDLDCPPPTCSESPVRFFVIGGLAGLGRTVASVDLYDPLAGTWTEGPELPEPRHHVGAAGLGGTVFVSGGAKRATDWTPEAQMWFLLPNSDRWERGAPMPEGRMGHQVVAVGQSIFVIGGRGETSNVLIYDTSEGRWSIGAQMPGQRDHLVALAVGEQIYAIGGRDSTLRMRVDIYDVAADAWREGPPLPIPMSAMAGGVLDDGIHIVGGEDPATAGGEVIDRHFVLAPDATGWTEAELPIVAVHGAAAAVVQDRLLVAGGARRQGALSPLGWTGILQGYPKN